MDGACLEVKEISKSYRGKKAVDGLSFRVLPGEILGLIGTNGAGKSTTISMIATLMKPDAGQILFHGTDIRENPRAFREKIGYVPQDIALYESLSGMDNLKFWGRAGHLYGNRLKERIRAVSGMIGFTPEMLKKRVEEYSGGMKRRLNIAAALLKEPELLILDEPTAGIDIQSRNLILRAIKELAERKTAVIYVGHYMDEVEKLCDSICVLDHGRAVYRGFLENALGTQHGKISLEQFYNQLFEDTETEKKGCKEIVS